MEEETKICVDCNTSKTPMWRSGPAGPKSLCNACGIRFRKKRIVVKPDKKKPTPTSSATSTTTTLIGSKSSKEVGVVDMKKKKKKKKKLRIKLMPLGKEVVLLQQKQRSPLKKVKRQKMENQHFEFRKFGEVEQAACLLMSLSYGSVFG